LPFVLFGSAMLLCAAAVGRARGLAGEAERRARDWSDNPDLRSVDGNASQFITSVGDGSVPA
jgi:hypothetical protein